jgi:trehalose 6-phosphate synthase/phosphatase
MLMRVTLVIIGKKNPEVQPFAINKGEIVKRLLYKNADSEFVFCVGGDEIY